MFIEKTEVLIAINQELDLISLGYYFSSQEKKLRVQVRVKVESKKVNMFLDKKQMIGDLDESIFTKNLRRNMSFTRKDTRNIDEEIEKIKSERIVAEKELFEQLKDLKENGAFYGYKARPIIEVEEYINGKWCQFLKKKTKYIGTTEFSTDKKTGEKTERRTKEIGCFDFNISKFKFIIPISIEKHLLNYYGEIAEDLVNKNFCENQIFQF